jgi:hypothetical protein
MDTKLFSVIRKITHTQDTHTSLPMDPSLQSLDKLPLPCYWKCSQQLCKLAAGMKIPEMVEFPLYARSSVMFPESVQFHSGEECRKY